MQLVACLPIESLSGPDAEDNTTNVKSALTGPHAWTANGEQCFAHIESVMVAAQPVCALFDYLYDLSGHPVPERKARPGREIGVINIGMNTLELLAVDGLTKVPRFTGGYFSGVRRLLELSNSGGHYTLAEMDRRLRSGHLDISNSLSTWANEVIGKIEERWGTMWKRFSSIIIVGGGSVLLRDELSRRFGAMAVFPSDSVLSTARGGYKLGVIKKLTEAVAIDAGYGNTKLYCAAGSVIMPAAVALNGSDYTSAASSPDALLQKRKDKTPGHRALHIESEHGSFWVGVDAHSLGRPVQSMDFSRLAGPEMLALLYGALSTQAAAAIDLVV